MKLSTYKTGKKAGQDRPIRIVKPKKYSQEFAYILDCISAEGYSVPEPTNDKEKLQFLYNTFHSEYGWSVIRNGEFNALVSWLQGLPTCCTIAFYNGDVLKLAQKWGSLPEKPTEKQEEKILETYWAFMAMRIMGLMRKHNIERKKP